MFERIVDWFRDRVQERAFEAFQIEVTSRCILRCVMCPRVALADRWPELDLPWEVFQRIARAFPRTKFVYLQGWGEPLLHPRLFDMIALAKNAGCRVGFTTNGMLLDVPVMTRLLELDLDLLAISIAGAIQRTHESIRVGSDFPTILDNVRRFLILKAKQRSGKPKVEIFFLMTKTNIAELPQAVDLAASLGVDELVATNLDYVITPEHDDLKAFSWKPQKSPFVWFLEEARKRAQRAGLSFRPYPLDPEEVAVCEVNPTKILFVSCDGWVSPCNYMGLPGRTDIPRRFADGTVTVPRLRFGNVQKEELLEIWEKPDYLAFRRRFEERLVGNLMRALSATLGSSLTSNRGSPPPEPCRTCYKLYGL